MTSGVDFWFTGEVEQRRVQTSKGSVEYADVGHGIPTLYFHGNAGNDAVMVEKSLVDDGFRLIVPNRPGYCGTPLTCGRSPNDCADLAAELLNQLRVERVDVIGTSGLRQATALQGRAVQTRSSRHDYAPRFDRHGQRAQDAERHRLQDKGWVIILCQFNASARWVDPLRPAR
jgi:hypothetical protein